MLSGKSCVSKSITVKATRDQISSKAHKAASDGPSSATVATETRAVSASMMGYRAEIGDLQEAHLPPSINQLITGTFSLGRILWPHEGQVEAGEESVIGESLVRSPSGTSRNSSHWH